MSKILRLRIKKALIFMREEAKLEFVDTVLADDYKTYINNYK
jgi:hypothetical protein